ncbi:MAG TPA: protein kinase [Candidatus Sulfotelmatobacter sp.]|nr:protein kinase [Candidatus Sulfotelmatobacter sp.]
MAGDREHQSRSCWTSAWPSSRRHHRSPRWRQTDLPAEHTPDSPITGAGTILGTFQYMAPEQVEGRDADARADIWAFGCVLYEMLTGHKVYSGETTSDILAGVIRAEPDWSAMPAIVPRRIGELVRRCLQKDPKQRLRDIGEARIAIEAAMAGEAGPGPAAENVPQAKKRDALPWAIAGVAVIAAIVLAALYWTGRGAQPAQVVRSSLVLEDPLSGVFSANPGSPVAISRDGARLVYVGAVSGKAPQLFLRPMEQQTTVSIPATDDALQPFFSPDGQWVGFFSNGKMRKVPLSGGPATVLCDAPISHGGTWASDGSIIYAPNLGSGLMRISAAGGPPQKVTVPDPKAHELSHRWPQLLPGNKAVLFTIQLTTQSTYDEARIAVLSLETGKWHTLVDGGSYARYVAPATIVYAHAGTLMAVPFDLAKLEATGQPAPAQEGVLSTPSTSGSVEYDVSDAGTLVYVPGTARPPAMSLAWVDRQGKSKELPVAPNGYASPRVSPNGKLLAVQILAGGPEELWIYDFARSTLMRLTFSIGTSFPVWMPDSQRLIYRTRVPSFSLRRKAADGSGEEETLLGSDFEDPGASPLTISPDGKTLLLGTIGSSGAIGLRALALDGSRKLETYLDAGYNESQADFSPDGRWVAYASNETGRQEVYVQPYPGRGGKWMISSGGGQAPRWSPRGREIFFRNDDAFMTVPVETQPTFKAGTPRMLFRDAIYMAQRDYDVAPDGEHFLMIKRKEASAGENQVNMVLHWNEELKGKVGK